MKRLLLTMVILLAIPLGIAAKTIELEVFRDWRGNNCTFKSSRPFFLINDIYDLENFWEKADADEPMPTLDFEKYMILVWNPGPSLFDHDPIKVDRFIYKDGQFIVLMDFERKDSGGFWRRPFVATVLPKVKKGDIFIMRKEVLGFRKVKWQPICTLWDMQKGRNMPFEMVKIDEAVEKPQMFDHSKDPVKDTVFVGETTQTQRTVVAQAPKEPTVEAVAAPIQTPKVAKPADTKPVSQAKVVETKEAKKKEEEDFFPDFGTPATKTEKKPAAASTTPKAKPAVDEDPLFGEEFDINF